MALDFRRRLRHARRVVLVEVALDHLATVDRDLPVHHVTHRLDDAPFTLVGGVAGIDDLAADVADDPHRVDAHGLRRVHAQVDHCREVALVAVITRHAHAATRRQARPRMPSRPLTRGFEYRAHPRGVVRRAAASTSAGPASRWRRDDLRLVQQIDPELQRILAGRNGQFIDEPFEHEDQGVAARRAHGAGRHAERHQGLTERVVLDEAAREVGARVPGLRRDGGAAAVRDEVIAPRHDMAGRVESAFEEVEPARAVEVVPHVVFARPLQLDRRAVHFLRNPRGFDDVVVGEPAAESTTTAQLVHGDVGFGDAERARDALERVARRLARRPDFEPAVRPLRRAHLGLELRMGDERIRVRGFDGLCRRRECGVRVPVVADPLRWCLWTELSGPLRPAAAALCRGGALVPRDLQRLTRRTRLPVGVGHNRHTGCERRQVRATRHDECVPHPGHCADRVEIGARHRAAEHGALLEHRVQHAGRREVDREELLARHDLQVVDAGDRRADDRVLRRILEAKGGEGGQRHRGGRSRHFAVAHAAARGAMVDASGRCRALGGRDIPLRGGSGDQQMTSGGADLTHRRPVLRRGQTAAGKLHTVLRLIDVGLFDAHRRPVGVELVGDDHRQHRPNPLTDFRVLRHDGHDAVGRDADERVR